MMKVLAFVSPQGEIIDIDKKDQDKTFEELAIKIAEKYLPELIKTKEIPSINDYLLFEGWINIVYNDMFDKGVVLNYRELNKTTFEVLNKYLNKNFELKDWSHKLLTDWAYETAYF